MDHEVKMLIVEPVDISADDGKFAHVAVTACAWDTQQKPPNGCRKLEDEPSLNGFIDEAMEDCGKYMRAMALQLATHYWERICNGEKDFDVSEIYVAILTGLLDKPVEFIGNMLATTLVEVVDEILHDPDVPGHLNMLRDSIVNEE